MWRFMSRFHGFQHEEHNGRGLGTYLLGAGEYAKAREAIPYVI